MYVCTMYVRTRIFAGRIGRFPSLPGLCSPWSGTLVWGRGGKETLNVVVAVVALCRRLIAYMNER